MFLSANLSVFSIFIKQHIFYYCGFFNCYLFGCYKMIHSHSLMNIIICSQRNVVDFDFNRYTIRYIGLLYLWTSFGVYKTVLLRMHRFLLFLLLSFFHNVCCSRFYNFTVLERNGQFLYIIYSFVSLFL